MNLYAIALHRRFWWVILVCVVTNRLPNLHLALAYMKKRQDRKLHRAQLRLAVIQRRLQEMRAREASNG